MPCSFRPTLEALEDRCTPSANPAASLGSAAAADLQHALLHGQIIANKALVAGVQAVIRVEQQVVPLLAGQFAVGLRGDIQVHQATLAALQQQGAALAAQDSGTDAGTFTVLRGLFPGAQ